MTFRLEGHEHRVSIVSSGDSLECDACDRSSGDGFSCSECKFTVHQKCAFVLTEDIFHHPSHAGHCRNFSQPELLFTTTQNVISAVKTPNTFFIIVMIVKSIWTMIA
ncbi:putative chromatin regulator PHD family [Arabidopsis thaliana]